MQELEAGDIVMVDARLIEVNQFEIDKSALTGESLPVEKKIELIKNEVPLADKINLIFKGTAVVKGKARAITTGADMHTELGEIIHKVDTAKQNNAPLKKRIQRITKILMVVTAVFACMYIISGLLQGKQFFTAD